MKKPGQGLAQSSISTCTFLICEPSTAWGRLKTEGTCMKTEGQLKSLQKKLNASKLCGQLPTHVTLLPGSTNAVSSATEQAAVSQDP